MSDSDYSDNESDDGLSFNLIQGNTKDPNLLLNDALSKMKHWKTKYNKCKKERRKYENDLKDANIKLKNLTETKLEYDKLKVDCDVEKRTFEMKLSNEAEQTKKYHALLKQAKVSLEEITQKHREIADLNQENEAKLFQTKIEYAGLLSGSASLEEQVTGLKDEVRSSNVVVNNQLSTIQSLSGEKSILQKDNQLLKERCKEVTQQALDLQSLCENLDKKYAALATDHMTLKNNSEMNTSSLNKSMCDSKDEVLQVTRERDSLSLNLSHTQEKLVSTTKKLSEVEELYKKEKLSSDENNVLLKQAESSLKHLKELYTEKENQLRKQVSDLECQLGDFKQELESTRKLLNEAQLSEHSFEESLSHYHSHYTKQIDELMKEKEDMGCEVRDVSLQIRDFNELLKKLKIEDTMKTDEYNYSIAQANEKVEILEEELSNRGAALCVLEEENEALRGTCDKARRLSEHTNSTNNKLEDEITTSKVQQASVEEQLSKAMHLCDALETEKVKLKEAEYVLATTKQELESQVFELEKSLQTMKDGHVSNQNLSQKKIDLLESKVSDQSNKLADLASEKSTLLVKLERYKTQAEHYSTTISQLSDAAEAERAKQDGLFNELNKSMNKNEDAANKTNLIIETLENEKIKWSGKECRYVSEIRGLQIENKELKVKLEDLTENYKSEIDKLKFKYGTLQTTLEEIHDKKIYVLESNASGQEKELNRYESLISHTITAIQTSLSHLTHSHTSHNPCSHSTVGAQRGGQTVDSSNTNQIAALNTELGHLSATSEHLKDKIKQLEEEKRHDMDRAERLNEEKTVLVTAKNELEIEMGKQRDTFKDEIRNMKNDMKNNENKHEVLKKKLEGSREELARMEHEIRGLQNSLAEKTNYNEKMTEETGSLKTDNNVLTHQLNEMKANCQEQVVEIENLKTRIVVIQEDNKNLRSKSDESLAKVKEKEVLFKDVQDKLYEANQQLHADQIKYIEEIGLVKEEFQERIYGLESEIKQAKYERDSKENQISALRTQINERHSDKARQDQSPIPIASNNSVEAASQYRELFEKYSSLQSEIQQLRSDKIILDNSGTQLKINLETERERLVATEQAVKNTTDLLNDTKTKIGNIQTQYNKANNDIIRLEELLKVEKDKYARLSGEYKLEKGTVSQTNISMGLLKDQLDQHKEEIKQLMTDKVSLEKDLAEKERMLSSEAKLRLHISSQLSSNSNYESALENERRKTEKLEEKCSALSDQIEKLKRNLDDTEASRRKLREEIEESNKPVLSVTQYEDKIRALKLKLSNDKDAHKKALDMLTKKVKEAQYLAKEELSQRKELTDKYIAVKSEIGELQGKLTVLLAENERLKTHCDAILKEKSSLAQDKTSLENRIANAYVLRSEVEMSKKNLETRNRVEMNRKLHEMNQKLDHDNKSRETIDKFKTATETKFREDLEKANRALKEKVSECQETIERQDRQVTSSRLESEKLKQILSEERRSMERMLPSFAPSEHIAVPLSLPTSPRSPLRQSDNSNLRAAQDANTTWQLMKSKLNDSLNKYLVEDSPTLIVSPGRLTPSRMTPGRGTPIGRLTPVNYGNQGNQHLEPDPVRTSADSFL